MRKEGHITRSRSLVFYRFLTNKVPSGTRSLPVARLAVDSPDLTFSVALKMMLKRMNRTGDKRDGKCPSVGVSVCEPPPEANRRRSQSKSRVVSVRDEAF